MKTNLTKNNSWRKTVRRYIFLFTLLTFFVIGCQEESSLLTPSENISTAAEPNWITLPMSDDLTVEKSFSTSGWIKRSSDSEFIIDQTRNGENGELKTIMKLKFYSGSVTKDSYITVAADDEVTLCTFGPSQVFLKPGYLYVKYEGLDLSGIDTRNVKFVYMNAQGQYEYIKVGQLKVDKSSGTLELIDGKIPHFSRYGFVN